MTLLKPFRHPRLWLCLWLLAIATVVALSLGPPPPFPDLPSGTDKLEHGLAYFLLAAGAVQLFRSRGGGMIAGLALVLVGIGVEFAQGAYTTDRMRDPFDAIANTVGVLLGLSTALTPLRDLLLRLEQRVCRPA
ncbi:VanZ family protein [Pseudoxanthomonas beigongshangi]